MVLKLVKKCQETGSMLKAFRLLWKEELQFMYCPIILLFKTGLKIVLHLFGLKQYK